jgi:Flp pilus assembly protein TadD
MTPKRHIHRARIQREAEGYLELGLPDHALQTLGRLGDPKGFDGQSLYLWGEALRASNRYLEALLPLQRAAKAAPNDIRISVALGWCYKRTGQLKLAIEALELALLIEPEEAVLRYNLACYLSLAGRKRRALRYLAQALEIDPSYRRLIPAESDFDRLRDDPEFHAICEGVEEKGLGIGD